MPLELLLGVWRGTGEPSKTVTWLYYLCCFTVTFAASETMASRQPRFLSRRIMVRQTRQLHVRCEIGPWRVAAQLDTEAHARCVYAGCRNVLHLYCLLTCTTPLYSIQRLMAVVDGLAVAGRWTALAGLTCGARPNGCGCLGLGGITSLSKLSTRSVPQAARHQL